MINIAVLVVALIISSVAAYYSVIGLTTIFAAAFWPVVVMGSSIEAAKVEDNVITENQTNQS